MSTYIYLTKQHHKVFWNCKNLIFFNTFLFKCKLRQFTNFQSSSRCQKLRFKWTMTSASFNPILMPMYVALFSCMSKSGRNQACFITLSSKSKSLFGCQNLGPFIYLNLIWDPIWSLYISGGAHLLQVCLHPCTLCRLVHSLVHPCQYIFLKISKKVSKINYFLTNLEKECP